MLYHSYQQNLDRTQKDPVFCVSLKDKADRYHKAVEKEFKLFSAGTLIKSQTPEQ